MKRPILIGTICLTAAATLTAAPTAPTNAPAPPGTITVQEMLVTGPPQLKMHSLSMILQGNLENPVDESYLPGLRTCSKDPSAAIRRTAAQVLGKHFIEGKAMPNPEAIALIKKLSADESADVRFNAAYYGLCNLETKDHSVLELLLAVAINDRNPSLLERIVQSVESNRSEVTKILDQKLAKGSDVAVFEVYQDFTGKPPANTDKYLDMPSSRPRVFIFKVNGNDAEKEKAELTKELKAVGIMNPVIRISGVGANQVLMVKTYMTKEGMAVEKNFSDHPTFEIIQQMWLPPELEIQLEQMQKAMGGQ